MPYKNGGNHASRWIRDPLSKGVSLILAYFQMFLSFGGFFPLFKKFGFLGVLGPPYCGIGFTIRIGREMFCLPQAGIFLDKIDFFVFACAFFYLVFSRFFQVFGFFLGSLFFSLCFLYFSLNLFFVFFSWIFPGISWFLFVSLIFLLLFMCCYL